MDETVLQKGSRFIMLPHLGKLLLEINTEFKNASKKNISQLILKVAFRSEKDFVNYSSLKIK